MFEIAPRPLTPQDLVDDLVLTSVDGVGPISYRRLCQRFGTAAAALKASADELRRVEGVGTKLAGAITSARKHDDVAEMIKLCERESIEIVSVRDPRYPPRLRAIHAPPSFLFVRGSLANATPLFDRPCLAIVGTRRASSYGLAQAQKLAKEATQAGLLIVSGLAHGIDAAAHRGAIEAGGDTVAVLGGGVLNVTPSAHRELGNEIVAHGCLVSEYWPHHEPSMATFPQRNRIVSGISLGVLIVEAPPKSGALITANLARKQGRVVMAIPGGVDSDNARGCHTLIRSGAILVESMSDILAALAFTATTPSLVPKSTATLFETPPTPQSPLAPQPTLTPNEQTIYDAIGTGGHTIDEVLETTTLGIGVVLATIGQLELRRVVKRGEGNRLQRLV
ncbi:MAG: DNA-processing protein DprA [Thermoguttaceae bacterium]